MSLIVINYIFHIQALVIKRFDDKFCIHTHKKIEIQKMNTFSISQYVKVRKADMIFKKVTESKKNIVLKIIAP